MMVRQEDTRAMNGNVAIVFTVPMDRGPFPCRFRVASNCDRRTRNIVLDAEELARLPAEKHETQKETIDHLSRFIIDNKLGQVRCNFHAYPTDSESEGRRITDEDLGIVRKTKTSATV